MAAAYGPLLTDRQREVWSLVYDLDWSLTEVAEALHISRAAVAELLKRSQERLVGLEQRLGLVEEIERRRQWFAAWEAMLADKPADSPDRLLYQRWLADEGFAAEAAPVPEEGGIVADV